MVIQLKADSIKESTKPMVIKAFASWCPHCAVMKPIFEQLEQDLGKQYIFAEFDIDKAPELTQQFAITSIPAFIFIKNKSEVGRVVGEMPQDELTDAIKKNLG